MENLETLLEELCAAGVEFVVVGGYAAMAHGVSRLTQDLDICMPFSSENVARLGKALEGLHPVHRMTPQKLVFEANSLKIPDKPLPEHRFRCFGLSWRSFGPGWI